MKLNKYKYYAVVYDWTWNLGKDDIQESIFNNLHEEGYRLGGYDCSFGLIHTWFFQKIHEINKLSDTHSDYTEEHEEVEL